MAISINVCYKGRRHATTSGEDHLAKTKMFAPLALITVLSLYGFASSEVYHIIPTSAGSCPEEPCIKLSQFADNLMNNTFNLTSNTTLIIMSGNHNLATKIMIENIPEFSMFSNSDNAILTCRQSAKWTFSSVDRVQISGLNLVACHFYVESVPLFAVENSAFSRHSGLSVLDLFSVGAVIRTQQSNAVFTHSSFRENVAAVGGVMFVEDSSNITFISCDFVGNHAYIDGGVLYSKAGCCVTVYNSTFKNNIAGDKCGVFMMINSVLSINNSFFSSNNAISIGGVICAESDKPVDHVNGSVIISKSNFTNNSAFQGGVFKATGILVLIKDNTYFSKNHGEFAGVVFLSDGILKIHDSVISNNWVVGYYAHGGAILSYESEVSINTTLLINNSAPIGGALYNPWGSITLHNSDFVNNTALKAGGVICTEFGNHIEISTCTFKGNHAPNGAVIFSRDKTTVNTYNIVLDKNTASNGIVYFIESSATFTGNTTINNNFGSLIFYYSNAIFNGCMIIVNGLPYQLPVTQEGGAITAFQSNLDFKGTLFLKNNFATNGGAIGAESSKLHVYGNISIYNNTAKNSGGGIYLYQSELNCKSKSKLEIASNTAMERGGGIHSISSTITSEYGFSGINAYSGSRLTLTSNNATSFGGGMCLENNAKLKVLNLNDIYRKNSENEYAISFDGNSALYGGALYVADDTISGTCSASESYKTHSTVTECFFQTILLDKVTNYNNNLTKSVYMKFTNNHALKGGSNLYGGLLDRCTQSPFSEIVQIKLNITNGFRYLLPFSNINTTDSISSRPIQVCFCLQNKPNCTYSKFSVNVRKGEKIQVPLIAVDQVGHVVSATIHSTPKSNESGISEGQLIQSTTDSCTNLTFNVFSPHKTEELIVYADGPCKDAPLSQRKILINFLPCSCSIGFQPKISEQTKCVCECDSKIAEYFTTCDYKTNTLIRGGNSWITFINTTANFSDYVVYPHCPLHYCKDHNEKTELNLNSPNGVDAQCAQFRTGTLCGACQSNHSLSLGSSHCILCPRYWPAMFSAILISASLAGVALVALILVLNLTVAVGTLNGVIFYANIVNANIRTFFPSSQPTFFSVFISWLNLDIGLDACFFSGMDAYSKTWLQLVFPTYMIFLVVMVILISERSKRFSQFIGKKNPVATLATLILLSYAKLLHTIIAAFSSAVLKYPGPNGGYKVSVWLPDATVEYLKGKHIVLFLAAILILLVGVAYTTLIFCWQWLLRFSESRLFCWTRNLKLHIFISETYHAPYTPKNRYWTGLLLFARVILYIASAANVSGDEKVDLLITGCIMLALLLMNQISGIGSRVYKKWPNEILEIVCHTNIALLCLATLVSLEDKGKRMTITNISMSVTFTLLLGILLYHLFTELIAKRCRKCSLFQRLDRSRTLIKKENTPNTEMSAHTSSVIERPQGNASYNPGLRESLLDHGDDDVAPTN